MTFSIGQRVRYNRQATSGFTSYFNSQKAGLIGIIVSGHPGADMGHWQVLFDKDQMNAQGSMIAALSGSQCSCYGINLELLEFKYDPNQTGDTDEDI